MASFAFRSPKVLLMATLAALPVSAALAQDGGNPAQGGGRGMFAGMQRVQGEVTAVDGATLTVKADDGVTYKIVTTDNTRVMRATGMGMGGGRRGGDGQAPATIKVSDIKVGDGLMGMGQMDAPAKTLHAAIVGDTDAATVKKLREDWGKTYINGRVTAVDLDNAKMTIERPQDKVSATIQLDESTSFRRGGGRMRGAQAATAGTSPATAAAPPQGEAITLADVKVGDTVAGQGSVKNGVFVPGQLMVMAPRELHTQRTSEKPAERTK